MIGEIEEPQGYLYSWQIVEWGLANLRITKPIEELADSEIRDVVRWIGMCSIDTIYIDGDKPIFGRIGIGLMLSITLLEFPDYYMKHELSQFN